MDHWCAVHMPGYTSALAEGFRTTARQQELFAQGRTAPGAIVTQKNGTTNPSNHQSCLAADIAFARGGKLTWDVEREAWEYLQHLAHAENLTIGSDWITFTDKPHIEWPTTDTHKYEEARKWKVSQGFN